MTIANVVAGNRVPYSNAADDGVVCTGGQCILRIRQFVMETWMELGKGENNGGKAIQKALIK